MSEALAIAPEPELPSLGDELAELEARMLAAEPMHGVALTTRMLVWGDIVLRTIEIPAGVLLAGARHDQEHVALMVGAIVVWEGQQVREMLGAHEWVVAPGAKRVGKTLGPTAWTTIHRIPLGMTDPAEIERHIVGEQAPQLVTRRVPKLPRIGDL
jgi:hypothetical protein